MDCILAFSSQAKSLVVLLFTEHWQSERGCQHKSHIYTYQENQCLWDSINLCNRKVVLTGFTEVCKPRNCLHNNCNWQGTKVKISHAASKSSRCDLRQIVKLWKNLEWIVWFTLMDNAMFSSVYCSEFSSGMDLSSLLKMNSTRRERSILAWDTNLIKERSKMNKAFANTAGHWQVWYLVSRSPLCANWKNKKARIYTNVHSICMLFWADDCGRLELKSVALIMTSHPEYYP